MFAARGPSRKLAAEVLTGRVEASKSLMRTETPVGGLPLDRMARSGFPSRLKSPTARALGSGPPKNSTSGW